MTIPDNMKTPGVYTNVNLNAQRTGLPSNVHKVLFVTEDSAEDESVMPKNIYDKAGADVAFGENSIAGRMITAAIKTNRTVSVQSVGKSEAVLVDCEPTNLPLDGIIQVPQSGEIVLTMQVTKDNQPMQQILCGSSSVQGFEYYLSASAILEQFLRAFAEIESVTSGGGVGSLQFYAGNMIGGDGSAQQYDVFPPVVHKGAVSITFIRTNDLVDEFDLFDALFNGIFAPKTIHSCGLENFEGY